MFKCYLPIFFFLDRNSTAKNTACYNKASNKITRGKNAVIFYLGFSM